MAPVTDMIAPGALCTEAASLRVRVLVVRGVVRFLRHRGGAPCPRSRPLPVRRARAQLSSDGALAARGGRDRDLRDGSPVNGSHMLGGAVLLGAAPRVLASVAQH
jgi:hypothetical protein